MGLRVVSGAAGGRRLRTPEGTSTRPTTDRVREAVFNSLESAGAVGGAVVVDLYAGSGAMGIEALSRGAERAWFVDSDSAACSVIEANVDAVGFSDRATVLRSDAATAVGRIDGRFDLLIADPPYDFDGWTDLLDLLASVAAPEAVGVLESDRSLDVGDAWEKMRERVYGGTVVTYVSVIDTGHVHMNANATGADP